MPAKLDDFTKAYIEAALFLTDDESDESGGVPLDQNYDVSDLADETLARIVADCAKFQADNAALLDVAECRRNGSGCTKSEQAGHDFWLTRNGHGAGFWDGDWYAVDDDGEPIEGKEIGDKLTAACKVFGEVDLCVGDDGKLYS